MKVQREEVSWVKYDGVDYLRFGPGNWYRWMGEDLSPATRRQEELLDLAFAEWKQGGEH